MIQCPPAPLGKVLKSQKRRVIEILTVKLSSRLELSSVLDCKGVEGCRGITRLTLAATGYLRAHLVVKSLVA